MAEVIFVIGPNAAGKSHFIREHYSNEDVEILDVYDYQKRAYDEAGENLSFDEEKRCLRRANAEILEDILKKLLEGRDCVVEHTLFKAKRRITYIDEIRNKIPNITVKFYVMQPSDELWEANIGKRSFISSPLRRKNIIEAIEFPNPAEGIDEIYTVTDHEIRLRMDPLTPEIIEPARAEIRAEAEAVQKEKERDELLASMKHRKFWHYCEVCGKKELLTAKEAFEEGWDYPPDIGVFGILGPRTCGSCFMIDTLFMKYDTNRVPLSVFEGNLSLEELITWRWIKGEPESLLPDSE